MKEFLSYLKKDFHVPLYKTQVLLVNTRHNQFFLVFLAIKPYPGVCEFQAYKPYQAFEHHISQLGIL